MSDQEQSSLLSNFDILDKIAKKNDRWLFVALLVIGMITIGYVVQWQRAELSARDTRYDTLEKQFIAQLTTANLELSRIVGDNTKAIEANNRTLERVSAKLDKFP